MSPTENERFQVREEDAGERLDKVLARYTPNYSRSQIQRLIEGGAITQDGETLTKTSRAIAGAEIRIAAPPSERLVLEPENLPIDILYEDPHLLVVDKPAGMVVHPSKGHTSGTLVHAILHKLIERSGEDEDRPGIVHRLDKDTSGLMVIARTVKAFEALGALFRAQEIHREYHAIALGFDREQQRFETLHARHPRDRKRFSSRVEAGKVAITEVRRLEALPFAALVECRLHTGRTHQIRVHLSDAGYPLLGDPLYGRSISNPAVRAIGRELGRQALHARVLAFQHPLSGEDVRFEREAPADFQRALEALRALKR